MRNKLACDAAITCAARALSGRVWIASLQLAPTRPSPARAAPCWRWRPAATWSRDVPLLPRAAASAFSLSHVLARPEPFRARFGCFVRSAPGRRRPGPDETRLVRLRTARGGAGATGRLGHARPAASRTEFARPPGATDRQSDEPPTCGTGGGGPPPAPPAGERIRRTIRKDVVVLRGRRFDGPCATPNARWPGGARVLAHYPSEPPLLPAIDSRRLSNCHPSTNQCT